MDKYYKCLRCNAIHELKNWNELTKRHFGSATICKIENENRNLVNICPSCEKYCVFGENVVFAKLEREFKHNGKTYDFVSTIKGCEVSIDGMDLIPCKSREDYIINVLKCEDTSIDIDKALDFLEITLGGSLLSASFVIEEIGSRFEVYHHTDIPYELKVTLFVSENENEANKFYDDIIEECLNRIQKIF
jgi:hypothetical protein